MLFLVRQVANRTPTLPRHVLVLCELPTPRVIRAIKECLPSSFNVQVLPWAPEIELANRLAVTPADELVANTTRLHVALSPQTVRVCVCVDPSRNTEHVRSSVELLRQVRVLRSCLWREIAKGLRGKDLLSLNWAQDGQTRVTFVLRVSQRVPLL